MKSLSLTIITMWLFTEKQKNICKYILQSKKNILQPKRILKMACNTVATYELFLQLFSKFWQDFESFLCFGTDIPQHYTSEVLENHSVSCCVSACHVHYTFTPQIVQSPMTLDKLQQNCGFRLFVDFKTSITKNCKCF